MILITGANNGLGLELVKIFLKNNFSVIAVSKSNYNLKKISKNRNLKIITSDLNKKSTLRKIHNYIIKNNIHINLLINNVTYSCIEKSPYFKFNQIHKIINTNLISIMQLTDMILNIKSNNLKSEVHVVNILSSVAFKGNINAIYTVSKWGLRGYTECLKKIYKNDNIFVTNITPCSMNTAYWDNKPSSIDKTKFVNPTLVAIDIYNHLVSKSKHEDLILKKERYSNV